MTTRGRFSVAWRRGDAFLSPYAGRSCFPTPASRAPDRLLREYRKLNFLYSELHKFRASGVRANIFEANKVCGFEVSRWLLELP